MMTETRFTEIVSRYPKLEVAILGDFCLDRYLEIDPARKEISIETGLPVHNVVHVRSQPGGAGTILNNLLALGIQTVHPIGFCGEDGEGWELLRSLRHLRGVDVSRFVQTPQRRTFTYCKPLVIEPGKAPVELNRLDGKNWFPTPTEVGEQLRAKLLSLPASVNALIVLDQVDIPSTGVITPALLEGVELLRKSRPELVIIADSRRGLQGFPPVTFKMNRDEFRAWTGQSGKPSTGEVLAAAAKFSRGYSQNLFVSMAEDGLVGADTTGTAAHVKALPLRGEIDVVGAGDCVTANLTAAMASGATVGEAITLANSAASVVIHQLGTTGTASPQQIQDLLF